MHLPAPTQGMISSSQVSVVLESLIHQGWREKAHELICKVGKATLITEKVIYITLLYW